jgi:sortase A
MAISAPVRRTDKEPDLAADEVDDGVDDGVEDEAEEADAEPPAPPSNVVMVASTALTILGVLLLGFVVQLVLLSDLEHNRAQRVSYANFRSELALGTAPVSAVDANNKPVKIGAPIAVLEIPLLHVREVVGQGTTSSVLADGPGHRRDSVLPGQVGVSIIMGRRASYGAPFNRLSTLRVGDRINVTTGQGVQRFGVIDVRRAGDPSPAAVAPDESRLVLMTATGAAYVPGGVLRVDAKLISDVQPAGLVGLSSSALPADEKPLQGEPGAWLPIVLWGQAMLAAALAFVWARSRWGFWQAWVIGVPILAALGLEVASSFIRLLPNLL